MFYSHCPVVTYLHNKLHMVNRGLVKVLQGQMFQGYLICLEKDLLWIIGNIVADSVFFLTLQSGSELREKKEVIVKHYSLCAIQVDNILLKGHLFFCNTKTETAPDENMFHNKASFDSYSDHFAHQLVIFLRLKVSWVCFVFLWI